MKLQCFSVYDAKVGAYMKPFFARSKGEASRSFLDACTDEKHEFFRHVNDFILYHLGEYDDEDSTWLIFDKPERLASAADFSVRPTL